ncbi:MAG: cation-translocating P-type ATPase [Geobacter sp.]|nr:MAG: cation-translocating P-type ATPase [Geobacter sp.]
MSEWHAIGLSAVLSRLETSADTGLSAAEAEARLLLYGPNELQAARAVSPWAIFLEQFKNILIVILLIATAISAVLGHGTEAIAITVIVLFAVILGFVQEYRAESSIEALRKMAAPAAQVIRDGAELQLPARNLVPGDVVLLLAGNRVPADLRLMEAFNLRIEESSLTGESLSVEKQAETLAEADAPIGDRRNLAFAGTTVSYGRGRGVVVATGMKTEFGKIAQMLQTVEIGRTPLQKNLDKIGRVLAWSALLVVSLIVALGLLRGMPFLEMFIFGIALAVAVVPEALPAVVTISLALGVQRMVRRNSLIRRLPAVETLGSTSVICSDKTGTLTRDEMTVRSLYLAGEMWRASGEGYDPRGTFSRNADDEAPSAALMFLLKAAALASDAHLAADGQDGSWQVKGDPTEGALVVVAAKAGLDKALLDRQFPRVDEIPFSSETKRMTTLHRTPEGVTAYVKGAPEVILASCSHLMVNSESVFLDDGQKSEIVAAATEMAADALRVLALAWKPGTRREDAEQGLIFLGLVGMLDPPRPEAKGAVKMCGKAGIRVLMITGDHPLTARAIAAELGILAGGKVIVGRDLEEMTDSELAREVEETAVYARVSPVHKLRLVTALQQKGYVVAMTGDGVNDAPALKKADIGIAMGITGTDVSREASAMTLLDDNFASIVAAVEEGRGIFENIKKYLMYLISSNIGEILLMAGAAVAGLPLPLNAVQILYVNLVTDGLPALALAVDPPESDLMERPPREPRTGVFTQPVVALMALGGVWSAIVNLAVFFGALSVGYPVAKAMSMTFVSLVLIQFLKAYNYRSDRNSVFRKPFANRWLNQAIFWELVLLVLTMTLPVLRDVFRTTALTLAEWLFLCAAAGSVVPVLELGKWVSRHRVRDTSPEKIRDGR